MGASRRLAVSGVAVDEEPGIVHVEGFANVCGAGPVIRGVLAIVCDKGSDDLVSFSCPSIATLEAAIRRCLNPKVLKSPAAGSTPSGSTGICGDLFARGGQETV